MTAFSFHNSRHYTRDVALTSTKSKLNVLSIIKLISFSLSICVLVKRGKCIHTLCTMQCDTSGTLPVIC